MLMKKIFLLVCFTFLLNAAATAHAIEMEEDKISLNLTEEAWITAKTAEVHIAIHASIRPQEAKRTINKINNGLEKISKTKWRFTRFNTSRDKTDTEKWQITAQTRLDTKALTGISAIVNNLSAPGLRFNIETIVIDPAPQTYAEAISHLRKTIIAKAMDEKNKLQTAMPGNKLRLKTLRFRTSHHNPVVQTSHKRTMEMNILKVRKNNLSQGYELPLSKKLFLSADIEFAIVK